MTRRQSLALEQPRPRSRRERVADRLLAGLRRISEALDRLSGLTPPTVTPPGSWDQPGPSEDTIAMQPTLPPEALR